MRILWTLFKVILGLAVAIPVGILLLALTVGVVGTLVVLAITVLKLAFVAFIGYGLYRMVRRAFGSPPTTSTPAVRELSAPDPYYEAAVRELDAEFGGRGGR